MKAVAFERNLPVDDPESLIDVEIPVPEPGPRDLLVEIKAVSVNPVDVKVRAGGDLQGERRILGYDAAGVVNAVGDEVTLFEPGDEVFYAGSIDRPGTNAELHLVDERIVGRKPRNLDFTESAALPLTALTAWEGLFDRFKLGQESEGTLLVLGGAGGVGSILLQLAEELTELNLVATASRTESAEWAQRMGAEAVIDHSRDLAPQLEELAPGGVDYIFSPHSKGMIPTFAEIIAPGGEIVAIDEPEDLDIRPLKAKSVTWHWELMFTRPTFRPPDMIRQHEILDRVAELVEQDLIRTTVQERLTPIDAATLRRAHSLVESGRTVGKVVLTA